jgi:diphthamide biosynthesis protein 4
MIKDLKKGKERAAQLTIDEISSAYETLCDPSKRAEVDRRLRFQQCRAGGEMSADCLSESAESSAYEHHGAKSAEVVDLDQMEYHEKSEEWSRSCRCGRREGFVVTAADLEAVERSSNGESLLEVMVACVGCSLWIKVEFGIADVG